MAQTPSLKRQQLAARMLHHRHLERSDPIAPPLISTSAFHLPGSPEADFQYGRTGNPTWETVEGQLAILEDAQVLLFPSGMAALTAGFMATVKAGDTVIIPSDGYFATRNFADRFLLPLGITIIEHPTADYANAPLDLAAVILVETPSNPKLELCDLQAVIAMAKAQGTLTLVDNTLMTPFLQRPLDLGADISIMSDTKAPGGHSDILMGHVASRRPELIERLKDWRSLSGSIPGAFEAWLLHRGLATLELRLSRMCETALLLATHLSKHPKVTAVAYPGLPSDPYHELACQQMQGFGFIIAMTLNSEKAADEFLAACRLLETTTSFGGVHSSAERRARWGEDVAEGLVRISVGCEPAPVLWDSIEEALDLIKT